MKENSIEFCDFFNSQFTLGGDYCDYSLRVLKTQLHHCTHVPILTALSQNNSGKLFIHILPFNNKATQILDTMTRVILL